MNGPADRLEPQGQQKQLGVDSLYQQLNALPNDNQEELMMWMGAQEGDILEA